MTNRPTSPVFSIYSVDSLDPPPPPPLTTRNADDAGSEAGIEHFEHTLNEHERVTHTFDDAYSEEFPCNNNNIIINNNGKRWAQSRKGTLFSLCLVLLIVVGVVVVGSTLSSTRSNSEISVSKLEEAPVATPVETPGVSPSMEPTAQSDNEYNNGGSECRGKISVDKSCYRFGDTIEVSFTVCDPGPYDWVGLFTEDTDNSTLFDEFLYWEMTCGGHDRECENPPEEGMLSIAVLVGPGSYQFRLVSHQEPESSEKFFVAEECGGSDTGGTDESFPWEDRRLD
jgi:hypothetical protein